MAATKMDEYVFNLSNKLEYSRNGEFETTASISFSPPTMNCFDESSEFEQKIMGALISAGKYAKDENVISPSEDTPQAGNINPSPREIKMLLYIAQDVKIADIANTFKKVAIKTAKLDKDVYLKIEHFEKITNEDFMMMLCGYASFFTCPSLLNGG